MSNYQLERHREENPWWVKGTDYPFQLEMLERREDQIRFVNQTEDAEWLKKLPAVTTDKPVLTAIKKRLFRLEVAWGYEVEIELNGNLGTKKAVKQGDEKAVRRWAMFQRNALRVISITPINREQWLNCYGNGKTRM